MKPLTLFELNSLVRGVIEDTLDEAYWVEAELSEAREVRGHCYIELIQKNIFSSTPVARASAKCWKSMWMSLRPKFERVTGQTLHAGLKVLLLVTANFHEAYGFSWIVQDIDPTYTIGDMARKRQEIIQKLKAEGVFEMQKELQIPMFAQRIAVISSENAAGYGDFCNQLNNNDYGFYFQATLFPAIMQGEQVEPTIIKALNAINNEADHFDVVVIIRGGGATADMSGFDTLALAENVANFPLPIITGIGHERDESVLDMVSCVRVKTPTAAAAFLIDNLTQVWQHIEGCQSRIVHEVQHHMDREQAHLNHVAMRIPLLFSLVKSRQEQHLDHMTTNLSALIRQRINREEARRVMLAAKIAPALNHRMTKEQHMLEQLSLRLKALDPQLLLKRGYSITLLGGHAIRDASQVKAGDTIETIVANGRLRSVVLFPETPA